jgi:hypothetical protein
MTPLNATMRWSQAMSEILVGARTTFLTDERWRELDAEKEMSKCPPLRPHHAGHNSTHSERRQEKKDVAKRLAALQFARVQFGSYEQLVGAPEATLRSLLKFFQLPVDDRLVRDAVRRVAKRASLKQGVTQARANVLFTPAQRAYAHRLSIDHNPFYLPIVSTLSPKPIGIDDYGDEKLAWLANNDDNNNQNDDDSNDAHAVAAKANQTFLDCWHRSQHLLENVTCHNAWQDLLTTRSLASIDTVRALLTKEHEFGNRNGVIRLRLAGEIEAQFKPCDNVGSTESWKAELIAHAVDRVLGLRRVPAVVPRVLHADQRLVQRYNDSSLDTAHRHAAAHLADVQQHCQSHHTNV